MSGPSDRAKLADTVDVVLSRGDEVIARTEGLPAGVDGPTKEGDHDA